MRGHAGPVLTDARLAQLAERLVEVPGVVAVALGGSRARGEHVAGSDVDLGIYYRPLLDTAALGRLARDLAGPSAEVTAPGGWGPWVDGGGWLEVDGTPVDWIYRDLDRVHRSWAAARAGELGWHFQVGHPLGFPSFAYAGEAALAVVLADPTGELTRLQQQARNYPPALREALVASPGRRVGADVHLVHDAVATVRALKAEPTGTAIYLAGGGRLAGSLLDEIDRLVLKVSPLVLGDGVPLFGRAGYSPRALRVLDQRRFASGLTLVEAVPRR